MAFLWFWSCCLLGCLCCAQEIALSSANPTHINKPITSQLSEVHTGLQVLLPSYQFTDIATVTSVSVKVRGNTTPISLQIWRPIGEENFELHWYVTFSENLPAVTRVRDHIHFDQLDVSVRPGDMLGLHVLPSDSDPISVVYFKEESEEMIFYYVDGVVYPYCYLAICNDSVRVVTGANPSIIVERNTVTGKDSLNSQPSGNCSHNAHITCSKSLLLFDDTNSSRTTNTNAGSTKTTETDFTSDLTHTSTNSQSPIPRNMNSSELNVSSEVSTTDAEGNGSALSTAAIAFVAIGAIFFVVLVILVIILCMCLCPRPSVRKTFVPAAPPQSGYAYRANLVVSSSVEQSNSSSNSVDGLAHHINRTQTNHTYANADVTQVSDFRPFTPIYINSDDENMRERGNHISCRSREERIGSTHGEQELSITTSHPDQISAHQSRDGRGWSVGPLQLSQVNSRGRRSTSVDPVLMGKVQNQQKRERRGWSVGDDDRVQGGKEERGLSSRIGREQSQLGKKPQGQSIGHRKQFPAIERTLPTTPLDHNKATDTNKVLHKRAERAKSVSATTWYKVDRNTTELPRPRSYSNNLSTVLTKPLPLPPISVPPPAPLLRRSEPQLNTALLPPPTHTPPLPVVDPAYEQDVMEASGDYSTPVPVSERYKYDPNLRHEQADVVSMRRESFVANRSHDYSDPDEPTDELGEMEERYDHLTPPEAEVHPEGALAALEGLKDDPKETIASGYVPTEEQRRMLMLHYGGHYEIDDCIDAKHTDGYDHLNYFKETDVYWAPAATAEDLYTQLSEYKYREISRQEISVLNSIGSGHFGTVRKGVWFNGSSPPINVAIKTVKNSTEQERVKLLQEAAIMGQFAHTYVVRLLGVVTVGEPVLVLLEYMEKGDLHSFLQKLHPKVSNRDLPDVVPKLFIRFSKDIANGMSYLAKKCFIHRDLAARNILINEELTCKIGDFGMARDIESEGDYYRSHGGIIPVKWTAPEALHYNKYSSASDVWSYGMVLFEIWSLGEKPFGELSNPIVIALVSSKHCQPPPPGCSRPLYHLMVECWNPDHSQRPTFDSIYLYLDSPEEALLQWQKKDICKNKLSHVLGAPLEEANDLYLDLQRTYQKAIV